MSGIPALARLRPDRRGVTVIEFALLAPALLVAVMGVLDLGYTMYTTTMLQGAVQQTARNSTLEGAASSIAGLDSAVTKAVRAVAPHATLGFDRKAYADFADAGRPEDFTDIDGDGKCDGGEPFEDANGNGRWDIDRGSAGAGGARDAVLYTVTVTYPRLFPVAGLIPGQTRTFTLTAQTVLRNQPYAAQVRSAPAAGSCE